jgi:hypothetical protein
MINRIEQRRELVNKSFLVKNQDNEYIIYHVPPEYEDDSQLPIEQIYISNSIGITQARIEKRYLYISITEFSGKQVKKVPKEYFDTLKELVVTLINGVISEIELFCQEDKQNEDSKP